MSQPTYEVQLAIYDLSRGMARGLSAQFLGPAHAIDIIPHTGIVVYGREYFFGGGIQSANPRVFRSSQQIFPIEVQSLGRTSVSQKEFEQWCQNAMRTGEYSAEAYDLVNRNCNNFSNDAALQGLRLSKGVPDWILHVPQRFLSSPMGQMVRPMLENMQMTSGAGGASAPFANSNVASPAAAAPPPSSSPSISASNNPWANIPGRAESSNLSAGTAGEDVEKVLTIIATPVLDSFNRPLLSNDTKVVSVCVGKLARSVSNETEKETLEQLSKTLTSGKTPSAELVESSSVVIWPFLEEAGGNVMFALMLMRLVVLHPPDTVDPHSAFGRCMTWVCESVERVGLLSDSARSMAWCTLSNAYKSATSSVSPLDDIVEAALSDLPPAPPSRPEVRQAATTFLYNVSLQQSPLADPTRDELPDDLVSMLCGCIDCIADELDATTRLRRLLVGARILKSGENAAVNVAAKNLMVELGFMEAISAVAEQKGGQSDEATKAKAVAREIQKMVEN